MTGRVETFALALSPTVSSYHTVSNGDGFVVAERKDLELPSYSHDTINRESHLLGLFDITSNHICVRSVDVNGNNTDQ